MVLIDDPMLVLITRFVVNEERLDISDEEFIKRQITAVEDYVARFPEEQKNERALEWVEEHAKRYRQDWQRKVLSTEVSHQKCRDCPLVSDNCSSQCEIHDRWGELLQAYVGGGITSRHYIDKTLSLLNDHKKRLNITTYSKRSIT